MYRNTSLYRQLASYRFALLAAACLWAGPLHAAGEAKLVPAAQPHALSGASYIDASGKKTTLSEAKGKLVALHLWATWCAPCIEELPEVDAAAARYSPQGLTIVAVALDGKNMQKVQDFMAKQNIKHLKPYVDDGMRSFDAARVQGLPATIFLVNGKEIARAEGVMEWNSKATHDFLKKHLK